jgi:hypothetical protein
MDADGDRRAFVPADTPSTAYEVQNDALRRLGGARRTAIMFELIELARRNARAGIRARHPGYDDDQVQRALCRLCLGDEIASTIWPGAPLVEP